MNTSQGEILELGHHEFEQRVESFDIDLLGEGPLVRLCIATVPEGTERPPLWQSVWIKRLPLSF